MFTTVPDRTSGEQAVVENRVVRARAAAALARLRGLLNVIMEASITLSPRLVKVREYVASHLLLSGFGRTRRRK